VGGGADPRIVVSEASGCLSVWRPCLGPRLDLRWPAHELCGQPSEVWCAVFNPWDSNTVLSGADDCIVKRWDLRCCPPSSPSPPSAPSSAFTAARAVDSSSTLLAGAVKGKHDAGVTSLAFAPSHTHPHVFASGSYDGTVRLWDLRKLSGGGVGKSMNPLAEAQVGGGVWRLKWAPPPPPTTRRRPHTEPPALGSEAGCGGGEDVGGGEGGSGLLLLSASMHSGVHVLRVQGASSVSHEAPVPSSSTPPSSLPVVSQPAVPSLGMSEAVAVDVVARYGGHASMAYGADWLACPSRTRGAAVASCSFYDHAAHFWCLPLL